MSTGAAAHQDHGSPRPPGSSEPPPRMSFNWEPVYSQLMGSVFSILFTPSTDPADAKELARLAQRVKTVEAGQDVKDILQSSMLSTGFAVGVRDGVIGILTAAHSLDHLFKASMPLTKEQINDLFTIRILCSHYVNGYLGARNPQAVKQYAIGEVLRIDCRRDLLLVTTPLTSVMAFGGGQCMELHPSVAVCAENGLDAPTSECLLVSSPSCKPDLMNLGHISRIRKLSDFWPNICEFDFEALEVQMPVGVGSSGGHW